MVMWHWGQSSLVFFRWLGLPKFSHYIPLAIHHLEPSTRFLGLFGKKRSIVTVSLTDDVSQKVLVWLRRA